MDEDDLRALEVIAKDKGLKLAQMVRVVLHEYIAREQCKKEKKAKRES
jgi:hypothetical protein